MPSPQTPLPERARGFENLQLFLAPLLLLWEKGLGDEGKRFVSQSGVSLKIASNIWESTIRFMKRSPTTIRTPPEIRYP
jgi:hypothetical protein